MTSYTLVNVTWLMALFLMGYNFTLRVSTVYCKFLIARSLGQTWGPSGADRTQVGPMMTPWTLLSWMISVPYKEYPKHFVIPQLGTYSIWQSDWVSTCREMFNCCPPLHHPVFSPINMLVHASILEIAFETLWNFWNWDICHKRFKTCLNVGTSYHCICA